MEAITPTNHIAVVADYRPWLSHHLTSIAAQPELCMQYPTVCAHAKSPNRLEGLITMLEAVMENEQFTNIWEGTAHLEAMLDMPDVGEAFTDAPVDEPYYTFDDEPLY